MSPKTPEKSLKAPAPKASDTALQSALAVEAHHLRVMLREISNHFVTEVESGIVRAIEILGEVPDAPKKRQEIKELVDTLQSLELKPSKGRLRDLKALKQAVEQMNDRLERML